MAAVLPLRPDHVGARRRREVRELGERVLRVPAGLVAGIDGEQEGALDRGFEIDQLGWGHVPGRIPAGRPSPGLVGGVFLRPRQRMQNARVTGERTGYIPMTSAQWASEMSPAESDRLAGLLEAQTRDPFLRRVAQRSLELLRVGPGARILEVGCGVGVLLPALAQLVGSTGKVVGVDYSPDLLARAHQRVLEAGYADTVELVEADAQRLPFEDGSFDAAHVERVLIHVPDADLAIREMRRVVRPNGWVVAAEPDNMGVRIDHPLDPEGMSILTDTEMRQMQHPSMGLELNRRFAIADLHDREIIPMVDFDGTYDDSAAEVDRATMALAVADGKITPERGEAVIAYLLEAGARGEYAWLGTMVIAAGRVPAEDA
jgi:SAM-dependent methyltransferase